MFWCPLRKGRRTSDLQLPVHGCWVTCIAEASAWIHMFRPYSALVRGAAEPSREDRTLPVKVLFVGGADGTVAVISPPQSVSAAPYVAGKFRTGPSGVVAVIPMPSRRAPTGTWTGSWGRDPSGPEEALATLTEDKGAVSRPAKFRHDSLITVSMDG